MVSVWFENVVGGLKALLIGEIFQDPKGEVCNRLDYRYALYFYISCQLGNNW